MPICTLCTHEVAHLYTEYQSAHNLRLEQCVRFLSIYGIEAKAEEVITEKDSQIAQISQTHMSNMTP